MLNFSNEFYFFRLTAMNMFLRRRKKNQKSKKLSSLTWGIKAFYGFGNSRSTKSRILVKNDLPKSVHYFEWNVLVTFFALSQSGMLNLSYSQSKSSHAQLYDAFIQNNKFKKTCFRFDSFVIVKQIGQRSIWSCLMLNKKERCLRVKNPWKDPLIFLHKIT